MRRFRLKLRFRRQRRTELLVSARSRKEAIALVLATCPDVMVYR